MNLGNSGKMREQDHGMALPVDPLVTGNNFHHDTGV